MSETYDFTLVDSYVNGVPHKDGNEVTTPLNFTEAQWTEWKKSQDAAAPADA